MALTTTRTLTERPGQLKAKDLLEFLADVPPESLVRIAVTQGDAREPGQVSLTTIVSVE